MISSLCQQTGDVPETEINVAVMGDTGPLSIGEISKTFDIHLPPWLTVRKTQFADRDVFWKRGLTRNHRLLKSRADWIWFGDCDMVVPPDFLSRLKVLLAGEYAECKKCMHTGRFSTELGATEALVNSNSVATYHPDAWEQVERALRERRKMRNIGAGFCQIYNVAHIREKYGCYVPAESNRDRLATASFWNTKSDRWLRRRVGCQPLPLPYFTHLQHARDNEAKCHLETQR